MAVYGRRVGRHRRGDRTRAVSMGRYTADSNGSARARARTPLSWSRYVERTIKQAIVNGTWKVHTMDASALSAEYLFGLAPLVPCGRPLPSMAHVLCVPQRQKHDFVELRVAVPSGVPATVRHNGLLLFSLLQLASPYASPDDEQSIVLC